MTAELGYWRPRQAAADDIADALVRTLMHGIADEMSWMDRALCAETDPEIFFAEKGEPVGPARRVCMACPVRLQCRDYAVDNDIQWGVWGAMTARERRAMKRKRDAA